MANIEDRHIKSKEFKEQLNLNRYYIIIGMLSLLIMIVFPMFGSQVGLDYKFPTTWVGWTIYIITKLLVATCCFMIFYSFTNQAQVNSKDHPNYVKAKNILASLKDKDYIPRSPRQVLSKAYATKGVTLFISVFTALIGLSQAILTYNYVELLSYIITIIMSLGFGWSHMAKMEEYWCYEFLDYAERTNSDNNNVDI